MDKAKFKNLENKCSDSIDLLVQKDLLMTSKCCRKPIVPEEDGLVKIWLKLNKPSKNPEYQISIGEKTLFIESFSEPFNLPSDENGPISSKIVNKE